MYLKSVCCDRAEHARVVRARWSSRWRGENEFEAALGVNFLAANAALGTRRFLLDTLETIRLTTPC